MWVTRIDRKPVRDVFLVPSLQRRFDQPHEARRDARLDFSDGRVELCARRHAATLAQRAAIAGADGLTDFVINFVREIVTSALNCSTERSFHILSVGYPSEVNAPRANSNAAKSSIVPGGFASFPFAMFFKHTRRTLPLRVFGSAGTMATFLNDATAPRRSRTMWTSSS